MSVQSAGWEDWVEGLGAWGSFIVNSWVSIGKERSNDGDLLISSKLVSVTVSLVIATCCWDGSGARMELAWLVVGIDSSW